MKEINDIEKLFSEGFKNFEAPVKPELWNTISQGISATGAGSTSVGLGIVGKFIIAATVVISGVVSYYVFTENSESVVVENINPPETELIDESENVPVLVSPEEVEKEINISSPAEPSSALLKETDDSERVNIVNHSSSTVENDEHMRESINGESKEVNEKLNESLSENNEGSTNNKKEETNTITENKPENNSTKQPVDNLANNTLNGSEAVSDNQTIQDKDRQPEGVFPNAFTPNGDGINDFLEIGIKEVSFFKIEVFTTRGELVYYSEDVSFRWDGNHLNGSPVPDGQYVYQIETKDLKGNSLKPIVKLVTISRKNR